MSERRTCDNCEETIDPDDASEDLNAAHCKQCGLVSLDDTTLIVTEEPKPTPLAFSKCVTFTLHDGRSLIMPALAPRRLVDTRRHSTDCEEHHYAGNYPELVATLAAKYEATAAALRKAAAEIDAVLRVADKEAGVAARIEHGAKVLEARRSARGV